jgi:hypothetical protein
MHKTLSTLVLVVLLGAALAESEQSNGVCTWLLPAVSLPNVREILEC